MSSIVVAGDTSGSVTLQAPAVSGSTVLTLPVATDTLVGKATTDVLTNKTLGSGTVMPTGSVLQVVNLVKLTSFSTTSTSFVDITGLTLSITPSSTNSKILVLATLARGGISVGAINLLRGATNLLQPTTAQGFSSSATNYSASDGVAPAPIICLDSPASVSSVTYKCQIKTNAGTIYIGNRSANDMEMVSTITLMEIAG